MAQVRLETVPELIQKAGEIRKDICRCARYAGNVHFGGPLSATDITVALYYKYLGFDPEDLEKPDRNMFVLSKGHQRRFVVLHFLRYGHVSMGRTAG